MSLENSRFTVVEKLSIRPNKIVFYNQFCLNSAKNALPLGKVSQETAKELRAIGVPVRIQPVCNKHNFELSIKATARIREKVTWLYELARTKTVTTTGNKKVFSFKMNFITLTLPAVQEHDTATITAVCLNQFLTECKERFGLANYVWRLEFQKNGNAHYHIATDSFIDYASCKNIWNRCLQKLNYVARYGEKMQSLSFSDYVRDYGKSGEVPFNTLRERYGKGRADRWLNPNTVDVRAVSNAKNISFYISKYITKKSDHTLNPIVSNREPSDTNLRLWFCSRSLSRLDKISLFLDEYDALASACLSGLRSVEKYIFDYCQIWYFSAVEQASEVKRNLWQLYRRYSKSTGYAPA